MLSSAEIQTQNVIKEQTLITQHFRGTREPNRFKLGIIRDDFPRKNHTCTPNPPKTTLNHMEIGHWLPAN